MSSSPEPAPRTKRRKIAIACNLCKSRKSRCDGVRPVCGPCSKKVGDRSTCSYRDSLPEPQLSFQIPNNYCPKSASDFDAATSEVRFLLVDSIETPSLPSIYFNASSQPQARTNTASGARQYANSTPEYPPFSFNNIEDYPVQPQSLRVTHQLSIGSIDPLCSDYTETPSLTSNTGQTERSYDTVIRKPSPIKSEGTEGDSDGDAMGCVDNSALGAGLLGTSSGASFMHLVRGVASDGSKTPDQGSKGAMAGHISVTLRTVKHQAVRNRESRCTEFILPTRKTANYLMKVYWDYSHPIFPWLDKADVTKSYNLLWTGSEDPSVDEQVFHCTLNLIFAIACVLDPAGRAAELSDSSRIYYDRAKKLFSFDLLDFSYFPLLQAFLLMAQYLQSTKLPRKCFQSIGIAIWIAQDLGLHLPETTSSMKDLRERELARRVWHGCILLDKIVAMAFGRPPRISTQIAMQAVMPLAIDEEPLEMHSPQPPDQPKLLDFYISYCKLHQILGDVLLTFYSPCVDTSAGVPSVKAKSFIESLDGLLEIDSRLVRFRNKLNPHLQVPSQFHDNTEIHVFERQANILNLRWLHTRILLFRPFFSQTFQLRNSSAEQDTACLDFQVRSLVVSHCLVMCVRMAQQIIEIIRTNLISERSLNKLPPWWYNVTYVYNAAIILIAAHMFPSVIEKVPASELRVSHEQALFILNHYEPFTQAASRCKSALEDLRKKIMLSSGDQPQMTEGPGQVTSQSIFGLSGDMANWGDATAYLAMVEGQELAWFHGQFFD